MAITFTPGLADLSAAAKAQEYNALLNQGFSDAQIRAAADATFGSQSASDWNYLTNLASQIAPAPAAVAPLTVEDLYQKYAGKTGDPEGLAFWKAGFGSEISPEEVASFQQSVAAVNAANAAPAFTNPLNNLGAVDNTALAASLDSGYGGTYQPDLLQSLQSLPSDLQDKPITDIIGTLNAIYGNVGATQQVTANDETMQTSINPIQYGGGWAAWENPAEVVGVSGQGEDQQLVYADPTLGGFTKQIGDTLYVYDTKGNLLRTQDTNESFWESLQPLARIALAAATAGGAGGALGSAFGLTGTAANAVGGALLGGGGAALTGGDVLKGALLGGAGGYLSGAGADPMQAAMDADIAGGMVPEFGTNAAYDAFMQAAMTPAAQAAIEQQIANSSVAGFTPDEIVSQGNLITDLASGNAMGPQTAEQLGQGFQNYMADAGYSPVTTTASTPSTLTTTTTPSTSTPSTSTPTQTQTGGLKSASDTILGMDKDTLKLVTTGASLLPAAASVLGIGNSTTTAPTAAAAPVDSRRLAQWDWDRIAADAAAANLGMNSFVSRNWNKFNQGEYNKPGAYFSSAPTPTPVTASTPATEPTQQTQGYSRGGNVGSGNSPLRQISYLAKGGGSGRDDTIPARLSDGEYVMDAETVSLLGDGSTNEGANRLDQMRAKIRQHKGKSMARGKFSANAKSPLAYLKESS